MSHNTTRGPPITWQEAVTSERANQTTKATSAGGCGARVGYVWVTCPIRALCMEPKQNPPKKSAGRTPNCTCQQVQCPTSSAHAECPQHTISEDTRPQLSVVVTTSSSGLGRAPSRNIFLLRNPHPNNGRVPGVVVRRFCFSQGARRPMRSVDQAPKGIGKGQPTPIDRSIDRSRCPSHFDTTHPKKSCGKKRRRRRGPCRLRMPGRPSRRVLRAAATDACLPACQHRLARLGRRRKIARPWIGSIDRSVLNTRKPSSPCLTDRPRGPPPHTTNKTQERRAERVGGPFLFLKGHPPQQPTAHRVGVVFFF